MKEGLDGPEKMGRRLFMKGAAAAGTTMAIGGEALAQPSAPPNPDLADLKSAAEKANEFSKDLSVQLLSSVIKATPEIDYKIKRFENDQLQGFIFIKSGLGKIVQEVQGRGMSRADTAIRKRNVARSGYELLDAAVACRAQEWQFLSDLRKQTALSQEAEAMSAMRADIFGAVENPLSQSSMFNVFPDASAWERPFDVLKTLRGKIDSLSEKWLRSSLRNTINGSPEINAEIQKFEAEQVTLLEGMKHYLIRVLRPLEQVGDKPELLRGMGLEDLANRLRMGVREFILEEQMFGARMKSRFPNTMKLIDAVEDRRAALAEFAPILDAMPNRQAADNLFRKRS